MASGAPRNVASPLGLEFPQSLAVYDDYAAAQKAVDFLSDKEFPVQNCMIVGTDLKRVERITGRLTTGRVALGGLISGVWLGLFIGLIFTLFTDEGVLGVLLSTVVIGALFGVIWALVGYAFTRGQRDFSSVTSVVATKYEVLVEHKVAAAGARAVGPAAGSYPRPVRLICSTLAAIGGGFTKACRGTRSPSTRRGDGPEQAARRALVHHQVGRPAGAGRRAGGGPAR